VTLLRIGDIVYHAKVFAPQYWQGGSMDVQTLPQTVSRLFALLEERNVPYVLVGGVALLQYVEGRNTQDIDLIVERVTLQRIPEIEVTEPNVYFAEGKYHALHIDFLLTTNPLFKEIQRNYVTQRSFAERDIQCATVEGLILLKLYALPSLYRQGDFARVGLYENDIATLLHYYQPDMSALLDKLHAYLNDNDWNEVCDISEGITQRLTRFRRSFEAQE